MSRRTGRCAVDTGSGSPTRSIPAQSRYVQAHRAISDGPYFGIWNAPVRFRAGGRKRRGKNSTSEKISTRKGGGEGKRESREGKSGREREEERKKNGGGEKNARMHGRTDTCAQVRTITTKATYCSANTVDLTPHLGTSGLVTLPPSLGSRPRGPPDSDDGL